MTIENRCDRMTGKIIGVSMGLSHWIIWFLIKYLVLLLFIYFINSVTHYDTPPLGLFTVTIIMFHLHLQFNGLPKND